MIKPRILLRIVLFSGILVLKTFSASAFTTNVTIGDNFFSPTDVEIRVNDSVTWNWTGNSHTTTSAASPPLWNSGVLNSGATFSRQFTSSGNFPFFCAVHPFMVGSVNVVSANQAPSVSITNPPPGAVFAAPWTGTIQATAADSDGNVVSVEFFTNSVSVGIVSNAPYNLSLTNVPAGSYTLKAMATDNSSATTTSANVSISVVTPSPITISDAASLPGGQFRLTYTADAGLRYVVERASVLGTFAGINTNMATGSSVNFTDNAALGDQKFYRVGRLPNP